MKTLPHLLSSLTLSVALVGCAAGGGIGPDDYVKTDPGKGDTSVEAIFVDMEFSGELLTSSSFGLSSTIEDQLLYTIGHLNDDNSLGRLDQLQLSNIQTEPAGDLVRVTYHASLPVAWGQRDNVPDSYTLRLPKTITFSGLEAFTDKYKDSCVDHGQAHDVTSGSMWYYYRTEAFGCELDAEDIVTLEADVSVSAINTTGKFPEYDKVWEDDVLRIVAVFGKFEDGATSDFDAGIRAYNRFVQSIDSELSGFGAITEPADVPREPGVDVPDIELSAELAPGKHIVVNALLVDNVRTAGPAFDARYGDLSSDADLIVYNGHAGLGANIRALARKGEWVQGQYAVVFMNGCDTYAYVDSALSDAHADVNPDDPNGTKYVDIVTNAMPSFFHSMPGATMALVRGLMDFEDPKTYEQMFANIDRSEVVLVSGEQDNTYTPGGDSGGGVDWDGMLEAGHVAAGDEDRFETPVLRPGRYVFDLTGTGDADLYVRIGKAPTTESFDCRPFRSGSTETCVVNLSTDAPVHVMVRGWAASSDYELESLPE